MDRRSEKVDYFRSPVDEATAGLDNANARVSFIPKFEFTPELYEEIFPGEPLSVEVGLEFGRSLIWGGPAVVEALAQADGSPGEATRRFLADRAN